MFTTTPEGGLVQASHAGPRLLAGAELDQLEDQADELL